MSKLNTQIVLVSRPVGQIDPVKTFEVKRIPLPSDIAEGKILIRVLYLSLDPAMRGWMNDVRSYIPPVKLGSVMRGDTVGQVVTSKHRGFIKGDYVHAMVGWQEYAVIDGDKVEKIVLEKGIQIQDFLGPLGGTGMTGYFGLLDIGKPKAGDTVVVSGAAGSTGSIVGQIAKIMGCHVIGIAGGEDKCEWLRRLGFDIALNYRSPNFKKDFFAATPKLIDIFFDNVGGEILDLALRRIAFKGRFVICGAISQYNSTNPVGPAYYSALITQRAKMEGFIVFDFAPRYHEAVKAIAKWIQEGKIQRREYVVDGLENAPQALVSLYEGKNIGKMMVRLNAADNKSML